MMSWKPVFVGLMLALPLWAVLIYATWWLWSMAVVYG